MGNVRLSSGLHLSDAWYDATKVALLDEHAFHLIDPVNGAQHIYHKTDGGTRRAIWDHTEFFIPQNIGTTDNAPVDLKYGVSNINLNVETQAGRDALELLVSGQDYADTNTMRDRPVDTGRYRYMLVRLNTDGVLDSELHEWSRIEDVTIPVQFAQFVTIVTGAGTTNQSIVVSRTGRSVIALHVTADGDPVDLTGWTLTFTLVKNIKQPPVSALLTDKATVIDDDPASGIAYVRFTSAELTLDAGTYVGVVTYDNGSDTQSDVRIPVTILKDVG